MKKLLVIVALATVVIASTPLAFATEVENQICNAAKQNAKVLDAQCVLYDGYCVLAIKTEKFVNRTEYETFVAEITEKIKTDCNVKELLVTRNPRVMQEIVSLNNLSPEEREITLQKIVQNEMHRFGEHHHPIPKKAG